MYNYRLTIQYDGGRYKGWQRLGKGELTIQDILEQVLSELYSQEIEVIGCSRTDAGVHAIGQVANFYLSQEIPLESIKQNMNQTLPEDIKITEVLSVPMQFHSRYSANEKTYLYQIWNKEYPNPFLRKYSMFLAQKLDIKRMREAGTYFLGTHDFTAFSNAKTNKKSMERQIYSIELKEINGLLQIRIRGNGFLYNMVRWMVGTLVEVGLGNLQPEEIPEIITSRQRNRTGNLAPAWGLYLEKIGYE